MRTLIERRADFRALHAGGCFLIPNPWDIGGAVRLQKLGFKALASSSAAAAWALGKEDYEITIDEIIAHLEMLTGATDLPVSADFENGFSNDPATIAVNVRRAIDAGVAGLSIEDRLEGTTLRDHDHAVACVQAAREAIDATGEDVLLIARTDPYFVDRKDPDLVIERVRAFANAGADCLFAPGVRDLPTIMRIVGAVAPKSVNVLRPSDIALTALADAGVRRISVGGGLAWAAWSAFDTAAAAFRDALPDR